VIDIGSVVNGKYRLVRILGDGGMGSVYEAQHAVLNTRVAIKVLHPELARRTGLVERFLQEARVVAQIRSPHVVQVIDVDRTPDGHAYIVMELLEGEPLSSVLDRQRKLPTVTACEYTIQILEALEAAHALGVIHRDLKPENVFVTFAGGKPVLKLIDFGIAKARRVDAQQKKLTVAGVVMGTAEYMAPEQARSADTVDARADLYAVGVLLYEMIAGCRPVLGDSGEDARVIALKVERGEVVPLVRAAPETPRDIAGHVHRAMAARPEMRFATATEMRLALEGAVRGKHAATGARPAFGAPSSGTVAMGAAVAATPFRSTEAVPVALGAMAGGEFEPPVDTVRAAPIATALAPAAYTGSPMTAGAPPAGFTSGTQRRQGVSIPALVGLALLLGASVVGILIGTGTLALSSSPPEPPSSGTRSLSPAATTTSTTTAANPASTPSTAANPTAVPTLTPSRPVPTTPRPPTPRPSQEGADAGLPPPFSFPTSLPPFPSTFPSGFPLPAGFPTALPSGFPTSLPGWPTLPVPLPVPKQSPPSSSSGY
jgi:serine/threonine protein kinase